MSIIQMLDDLETGNFLLLSLSFVILFVSGFVIGIVRDYPWMIYLASVVAGIYVVFAKTYSIVKICWLIISNTTGIIIKPSIHVLNNL